MSVCWDLYFSASTLTMVTNCRHAFFCHQTYISDNTTFKQNYSTRFRRKKRLIHFQCFRRFYKSKQIWLDIPVRWDVAYDIFYYIIHIYVSGRRIFTAVVADGVKMIIQGWAQKFWFVQNKYVRIFVKNIFLHFLLNKYTNARPAFHSGRV